MRKLTLLTILGLLGPCGTADADFSFLSAGPHVVPGPVPSPTAPLDIRPATTLHGRSPRSKPHRAPTRPSTPLIARGFGDQIPLSFAVRQIVPPSINVTFGPGADDAALVDWRGGKPWRLVLDEAIEPLGLRLDLRDRSLTITRP